MTELLKFIVFCHVVNNAPSGFDFKDFLKGLFKIAVFLFLVSVAIGLTCFAAEQIFGPQIWGNKAHGQTINRTYQDNMGRSTGRSSTDTRGNTTFYNERGQNTGRSSTSNGTTTFYNERGQQTGRSTAR
jgi:hypothetical protein